MPDHLSAQIARIALSLRIQSQKRDSQKIGKNRSTHQILYTFANQITPPQKRNPQKNRQKTDPHTRSYIRSRTRSLHLKRETLRKIDKKPIHTPDPIYVREPDHSTSKEKPSEKSTKNRSTHQILYTFEMVIWGCDQGHTACIRSESISILTLVTIKLASGDTLS